MDRERTGLQQQLNDLGVRRALAIGSECVVKRCEPIAVSLHGTGICAGIEQNLWHGLESGVSEIMERQWSRDERDGERQGDRVEKAEIATVPETETATMAETETETERRR